MFKTDTTAPPIDLWKLGALQSRMSVLYNISFRVKSVILTSKHAAEAVEK